MKRRTFLSVCGTGVAAAGFANTACGDNNSSETPAGGTAKEASKAAAAAPAAAAADKGPFLQTLSADVQRVVLRAVGLNAFFVTTQMAEDEEKEVSVDVVGLDSGGVKLNTPEGEKTMHPHVPMLVIATDHVVDPSTGKEATDTERGRWNLRTNTKKFHYWPLTKKQWSIENIVGPDLAIGVYGVVPLKQLNAGLTTLQWQNKPQASAKLKLTKGSITDDAPRPYRPDVHRRQWRFTNREFEQDKSTKVRMTDTVRIELDANAAQPATFNVEGLAPIVTKGNFVEAYLLTLPHQLLDFEIRNFTTLHHVTAAYHLFDAVPSDPKILPKTGSSGAGEEPVFCPPVWMS